MRMIPTINDGTSNPPRLQPYLNLGTLDFLPDSSTAPRVQGAELAVALKEAGFEGLQGADAETAQKATAIGMALAGGAGRSEPSAYDDLAKQGKDLGHVAMTLHVGNGMESEDQANALFDAICNAQAKHGIPLYVETHRATLTQDVWRTVQFVNRFPQLGINGDYSHWYTGLEMPYAGVDRVMKFTKPVSERVRFMHGRIGNSGCMQVDIGQGDPAEFNTGILAANNNHLADFAKLWGYVFRAFKQTAGPGDVLPFAPELLNADINYARRLAPDTEETDRWQQALVMLDFAKRTFDQA